MKRKIMQEMQAWKEKSSGKTALLIDGARRVGKSYIAEAFAKEKYKCKTACINLQIQGRILQNIIRSLKHHQHPFTKHHAQYRQYYRQH